MKTAGQPQPTAHTPTWMVGARPTAQGDTVLLPIARVTTMCGVGARLWASMPSTSGWTSGVRTIVGLVSGYCPPSRCNCQGKPKSERFVSLGSLKTFFQ